jgi:hypothetical protein
MSFWVAAGSSVRRPSRQPDSPFDAATRPSTCVDRGLASGSRNRPPILGDVIGPAPLLALLVAVFHTALYVLIRGSAGGQLPLLLLAAFLGSWAGDAIGARLGVDVLRIGDFRLVAASVLAWVGLAVVSVVAVLGPSRRPKVGS